ncbi:unnamed protein product [Trifolium pratense]|uniref:Uncharacterized protein n=1 Tax=Trifolium pratense TaxID=57577 RepID=A0ACB0IXU6_TRIPR|nr:unnamed protein product [Trifolium pratense]
MSGNIEKEGGLVSRPPLLVGVSNYDYWKSRMIAFLKSMDSKTWKAVLKGWDPPVVIDKDGKPTLKLKAEEDWSKEEDELALGNSKALYALYNGVDKHIFKLIKKCVSAKEAWKILETVHEGTPQVKMSKLQILTTQFENLRMKEEETIQDFHMTILDYDNQFDALGEKIPEEKLVRKMLRSLPKKFDMKVTAMEEAKNISEMKLDELVGSLQTYESVANGRSEKKNKSIAFSSKNNEEELEDEEESNESISEAMVLLGKQFNKVLKRMDKRPRSNFKNNAPSTMRSNESQGKPKGDEKSNLNRNIRCHECEGYGHIRPECPTYQKRAKKGLTVSWSEDDDSEDDTASVTAKHISVLTGIVTSDTESDDGEVTYEELAASYKELCLKSEEICRVIEKQKVTINELKAEKSENISKIEELQKKVNFLSSDLEICRVIEKQKVTINELKAEKFENISKMEELQKKVNYLSSDLEEAKEVIEKLNTDIWRLRKFSDMLYKDDEHLDKLHKADGQLEEILEKNVRKPRNIGLSYENVNKFKNYSPDLMYMEPKETQKQRMPYQKPQHHQQHPINNLRFDKQILNHVQLQNLLCNAIYLSASNSKGTMNSSIQDFKILKFFKVACHPPSTPKIIQVNWIPPPNLWIKCNSGGASKGSPGLAACGGIFRDCRCTYVGGFSCNLGISNSLFAELTAAMLSIEMAHDRGWRYLWLECDSLLTVQAFINSLIVS